MTRPEKASAGLPRNAHADGVGPELRKGGVIAGLFFVGLLGSAALIPLDAGAMADGVIAVSGNRQAVQHRDGGIVTRLNVSEGQMVAQGDLLLQISASELIAAERGMTGEAVALQALRARLLAERANLLSVAVPAAFENLAAEDKMLADEAMLGQTMMFEARINSIATERSVLQQRIKQHSEQIAGAEHQIASTHVQQRLMAEELDGLRTLVPNGYVAINRIREMERRAAEMEGKEGSHRSEIARLGEAVGEARLQILSLERQRSEEVAAELRDVQVRLDEILPKLTSVREQIARATVRAPTSGQVVGLQVFTEGGVVAAGATLMEIVPRDRSLVIAAKASPTDADDLAIGMHTQIRFPALQEKSIPIIGGLISKVSADSFEDERTGKHYFEIEVMVPPDQLAKLQAYRADGGIRAGLPAEVMVPMRKRTALAYLIEPITQTVWRAGREY
ncbi:MAG: HlyD family type I secretion periplasmic adaptor subunit [Alphaproteobacteria bacterium]|nr:MAG: HlyD family type I secretion periplasmic adaptor subunit [Alphaproteobacteria bacterium]